MRKREKVRRNVEKMAPLDRGNVIDLRGASKLHEASVFAALTPKSTEQQRVASARLGINAYQVAQGRSANSKRCVVAKAAQPEKHVPDDPVLRSEASIKKVKFSILKALHAQSNAGSVNLRDVSSAIDKILRET